MPISANRLFQTARVLGIQARRAEAAELLSRAIDLIDRDGIDSHIRADLVALRDRLTDEVPA